MEVRASRGEVDQGDGRGVEEMYGGWERGVTW